MERGSFDTTSILTTLSKVLRSMPVPDERKVDEERSCCRSDGHPEGLSVLKKERKEGQLEDEERRFIREARRVSSEGLSEACHVAVVEPMNNSEGNDRSDVDRIVDGEGDDGDHRPSRDSSFEELQGE